MSLPVRLPPEARSEFDKTMRNPSPAFSVFLKLNSFTSSTFPVKLVPGAYFGTGRLELRARHPAPVPTA